MAQITLNSSGVASSGSLLLQTNGTTTQATVDTSGNLGLGVTPSAWGGTYKAIQFGSYGAVETNNSNKYVALASNHYNNGSGDIYIANGYATRYYQDGSGAHVWNTAASGTAGNAITFTQAMTLNANGVLALQGASTSANGVGITFPATQSASTDANTLDDYEEGTWTPTWSVSGGTIAAVNNEGFYTKVGRQVFVGGYIAYGNSTTGTPTGALSIAGLPFTSSTGYGQGGGKQAGRGYAGYNFWGTTPQTTLGIAASGTTLALSAVYTDMSRSFNNSDQVYFFATYFV